MAAEWYIFSLQSTPGPLRDFWAWEGGRVTCLFLVDTRFTEIQRCAPGPTISYLPLVRLPWCLVLGGGAGAEGERRPVGGGMVGCCYQSEECPSLAGSWETSLFLRGLWPAQSKRFGKGSSGRQEMLFVCVGLACTSPCRCSMGRAAVPDLSGKERVKPGAQVGSSPDTSADPLCDPSRSSASQALPFLIYKVETATSISAGLRGNYSSNASNPTADLHHWWIPDFQTCLLVIP